ncbi:hypothetical protein EYZ11_005107 [Aspergillus tanneri]|uniref:54S ribosomal protein L31, mitochondrial n=1 Tax=Aspergillus tanneri TaxID=1220188 RepID=A0A4S3JJE0_9EURO|nr:hypothetical protein EYZ11_005107 [Aspergillus tanneri]
MSGESVPQSGRRGKESTGVREVAAVIGLSRWEFWPRRCTDHATSTGFSCSQNSTPIHRLSTPSICPSHPSAKMMFKPSSPLFSGLLWKIPWRISSPQKARQRKRLRAVDNVVDTVSAALQRNGVTAKAVDRWYREMPREQEMLPKDKYTIFDKKEKKYRKGIHKLPKWTRVSQRVNPPGF